MVVVINTNDNLLVGCDRIEKCTQFIRYPIVCQRVLSDKI